MRNLRGCYCRLKTALNTSLMPMAPTKRDCSSNSATGAVCERCMASITVLSGVPGRAQNTCGASSGSFSTSSQDDPDGRLAVALGGRHQAVGIDLEARGLATVEPEPAALAGTFEVAAVAHDVPGGEHRERIHIGDEVAHVVIGGAQHDVFRRAGLDDAAALHDGDVAADLQRLLEIVARRR